MWLVIHKTYPGSAWKAQAKMYHFKDLAEQQAERIIKAGGWAAKVRWIEVLD